MITLYLFDVLGFYAGSVQFGPLDPVIPNSTVLAPPTLTGTEVARWNNSAWQVLASYPTPDNTEQEASVLRQSEAKVIQLMEQKQRGTFTYGGGEISLSSIDNIDRMGTSQNVSRKIAPRVVGGDLLDLNAVSQIALADAADTFIQSIEDHAYDLIEDLRAGNFPDIESGWPS